MSRSLAKYRIGLIVLGLFTLGLLIMVVVQAGPTKTDANTYKSASDIADKLNNYVFSYNYIPNNLAVIGVTNVPSTITYQKISDTSFKFCINYKTSASNIDRSSVESSLINAYAPGITGSDNSTLIIDPGHHKGLNCQTIQPNIVVAPTFNTNNSSSSDSVTF